MNRMLKPRALRRWLGNTYARLPTWFPVAGWVFLVVVPRPTPLGSIADGLFPLASFLADIVGLLGVLVLVVVAYGLYVREPLPTAEPPRPIWETYRPAPGEAEPAQRGATRASVMQPTREPTNPGTD